ncbi:MAG: ATP-dependent DNA helicase [Pseudomonadota bacterium]
MTTQSAGEVLGADGPLSALIDGFKPRPGQQALADAIESTFADRGTLIAEAGTGVGKTFAYLVPALRSGLKVIVSTGTRHLQDQLYQKDLPVVAKVFDVSPRTALLKGRANYLCRSRLARAKGLAQLDNPDAQAKLATIERWALRTHDGDISQFSAVPEDDPIWQHVTSNAEYCAEHEPDELDGCYVTHARRRAQEADVVVVNHHLFCADLALREEGFGEILPTADAFIFDEAHQLPDVATQFFGKRLSTRHATELARDTIAEHLSAAPDQAGLRHSAEELERAMRDLRLALGVDTQRAAWVEVAERAAVAAASERLLAAYRVLAEELEVAAERSRGLEACGKRAERQRALLSDYLGAGDEASISWFETYNTGLALNVTPLDVAAPFARNMGALSGARVYVSATLAVGGSFSHFRAQLGIETDAEECIAESPFDYRRNAMLLVPPDMPAPASPGYDAAVLDVARRVIRASRGRCFLLFTSHRAMNHAAEALADRIEYPMLVQGSRAKTELLDAFRRAGDAVLLGTSSFWEGVDVRGEALSCVLIDKLPFSSPVDPVMRARIDALNRKGGNAFMDFQLPQAITQLKQGVGRLIRDESDRGVMVLCDPRLVTKNYGALFINSLPRMYRTRVPDKVEAFFARDAASADGTEGEGAPVS